MITDLDDQARRFDDQKTVMQVEAEAPLIAELEAQRAALKFATEAAARAANPGATAEGQGSEDPRSEQKLPRRPRANTTADVEISSSSSDEGESRHGSYDDDAIRTDDEANAEKEA